MMTGKRDASRRPKARTLSIEVLEDRLLLSNSGPADVALGSFPAADQSSNQPLVVIQSSKPQSGGVADASPALPTTPAAGLKSTVPSDGNSEKPGSETASPALVANATAVGGTGAASSLPKPTPSDLSGPSLDVVAAGGSASSVNTSGHNDNDEDDDAPKDRYLEAQAAAQHLALVSYSLVGGKSPSLEGGRPGQAALPLAPQPSIPEVYPTPLAEVAPVGADTDQPPRIVAAGPVSFTASESASPQPSEVVGLEDSAKAEPNPLFTLADARNLIELPVQFALPVQTVLPMDLRDMEQTVDAFFAQLDNVAQLDNLSPQGMEWCSPSNLAPAAIVATAVLFECLRRWEKKSTRRLGPSERAALGLADVPLENEA